MYSSGQCSFSWAVWNLTSHSAEQRGGCVMLHGEWPAVKNWIFSGFTEGQNIELESSLSLPQTERLAG